MSMRDYEELCRTADERATKVPFHRTVTHLVRARRSVDRGEPVWALAHELAQHRRVGAGAPEFARERDRQEEAC